MAQKKQYKAETKRLLDLMIHSIYTHKEIFLRELISNASDALDKIYHASLHNEVDIDRTKLQITLEIDEKARTLIIRDNGIGMTQAEIEDNLGVIAKSGSNTFKKGLNEEDQQSEIDIIGQFGVGFYSAFMVTDKVEVISQSAKGGDSVKFESEGEDGYRIEVIDKQPIGTTVKLHLKADDEGEHYSIYLENYHIKSLIKKYSDYIRYPIKMTETQKDYDDKGEVTGSKDVEITLNSMIPLWKRNKNDIKDEDYNSFYQDKFNDYQAPSKVIHTNLEGALSFDAMLFIPSHVPQAFYTQDYQAGLQLYSRGVFILDHAKDLLPDAFRFVRGLVDSPDLSLNISREMLQHDRQLKAIASRLEKKIKGELLGMLKTDREKYEAFYKNFGLQIKYGAYAQYGANKELLEDLILFGSSKELKMVSLEEYVERMKEDQKEIYYVCGDSLAKCDALPQTEWVKEKGFEILYLVDDVDEFILQVFGTYKEKPFKAINQGELNIGSDEEKKALLDKAEANKPLLESLKEALKDQVSDVRLSSRLKTHPVCLVSDEGLSLEMEKILSQMPEGAPGLKAKRILELNSDHPLISALSKISPDKVKDYAELLYSQALLIEGFTLEDPVRFSNQLAQLMIDASK
ncbi:MAG: heat shock protein 90 [Erysipelotrichaceae bacterium]|nr:MAG: heat shock protein [Erysipelotrichaceae bacterium]TXT19630.1 MAG: heat shock protein 90 [Erysipelotrichaceae bacterium]